MVDPRERRLVMEAHLVDLDAAIHAGDWRRIAEEARYVKALLTQIEHVAERRMEEARRDQRR